MKIFNRIVLAALALCMVLPLVSCSGDSDTLVMATNAEFPPYEYRENDKIIGIDVEIAEAIAEKLGKKLVIEDMAFDSIITAVESGKADMGVAGMTITEDRLKNVNFSTSYITASQVIIVRKDNNEIKSPADLEGKTVGVQQGTTGDIYAEDITDVKLERYNKGFEAVQALIQKKVDAVIIDDQPAQVFVKENSDLTIIDEEFTFEEYAIAIAKKNDKLLEKVNAAIAELRKSGKLQEIFDKYISAE